MISFELPKNVLEKTPSIDPTAFVANGAHVIGDVTLRENSSVWYGAVLRGDINRIEIGQRSNIQDGCIVHLENDLPCIVGNDCIVGHGAILHGCLVEDACLIGNGAIVLSGAKIGKGSIIGAGTVVLENTVVNPFSLMVGTPARFVRELPESTFSQHQKWAEKYVQLSRVHKKKS